MNLSKSEFHGLQNEFRNIYAQLGINFYNLTQKYKTRPKFKLTFSDDLEPQLLLPPSFHKKHGDEFVEAFQTVYQKTSFYKICKTNDNFSYPFYERIYYDETNQYIMFEFDKDIYGSTYSLFVNGYDILSEGIYYFLHSENKKD